jgi:hypothetical protein
MYIVLVGKPYANRSQIRIGRIGIPRNHPDYNDTCQQKVLAVAPRGSKKRRHAILMQTIWCLFSSVTSENFMMP